MLKRLTFISGLAGGLLCAAVVNAAMVPIMDTLFSQENTSASSTPSAAPKKSSAFAPGECGETYGVEAETESEALNLCNTTYGSENPSGATLSVQQCPNNNKWQCNCPENYASCDSESAGIGKACLGKYTSCGVPCGENDRLEYNKLDGKQAFKRECVFKGELKTSYTCQIKYRYYKGKENLEGVGVDKDRFPSSDRCLDEEVRDYDGRKHGIPRIVFDSGCKWDAQTALDAESGKMQAEDADFYKYEYCLPQCKDVLPKGAFNNSSHILVSRLIFLKNTYGFEYNINRDVKTCPVGQVSTKCFGQIFDGFSSINALISFCRCAFFSTTGIPIEDSYSKCEEGEKGVGKSCWLNYGDGKDYKYEQFCLPACQSDTTIKGGNIYIDQQTCSDNMPENHSEREEETFRRYASSAKTSGSDVLAFAAAGEYSCIKKTSAKTPIKWGDYASTLYCGNTQVWPYTSTNPNDDPYTSAYQLDIGGGQICTFFRGSGTSEEECAITCSEMKVYPLYGSGYVEKICQTQYDTNLRCCYNVTFKRYEMTENNYKSCTPYYQPDTDSGDTCIPYRALEEGNYCADKDGYYAGDCEDSSVKKCCLFKEGKINGESCTSYYVYWAKYGSTASTCTPYKAPEKGYYCADENGYYTNTCKDSSVKKCCLFKEGEISGESCTSSFHGNSDGSCSGSFWNRDAYCATKLTHELSDTCNNYTTKTCCLFDSENGIGHDCDNNFVPLASKPKCLRKTDIATACYITEEEKIKINVICSCPAGYKTAGDCQKNGEQILGKVCYYESPDKYESCGRTCPSDSVSSKEDCSGTWLSLEKINNSQPDIPSNFKRKLFSVYAQSCGKNGKIEGYNCICPLEFKTQDSAIAEGKCTADDCTAIGEVCCDPLGKCNGTDGGVKKAGMWVSKEYVCDGQKKIVTNEADCGDMEGSAAHICYKKDGTAAYFYCQCPADYQKPEAGKAGVNPCTLESEFKFKAEDIYDDCDSITLAEGSLLSEVPCSDSVSQGKCVKIFDKNDQTKNKLQYICRAKNCEEIGGDIVNTPEECSNTRGPLYAYQKCFTAQNAEKYVCGCKQDNNDAWVGTTVQNCKAQSMQPETDSSYCLMDNQTRYHASCIKRNCSTDSGVLITDTEEACYARLGSGAETAACVKDGSEKFECSCTYQYECSYPDVPQDVNKYCLRGEKRYYASCVQGELEPCGPTTTSTAAECYQRLGEGAIARLCRNPFGGTRYNCTCPSGSDFGFTEDNCPIRMILTGKKCGGKYTGCECHPGYIYTADNCTDGTLSGGYCQPFNADGSRSPIKYYAFCTCPPEYNQTCEGDRYVGDGLSCQGKYKSCKCVPDPIPENWSDGYYNCPAGTSATGIYRDNGCGGRYYQCKANPCTEEHRFQCSGWNQIGIDPCQDNQGKIVAYKGCKCPDGWKSCVGNDLVGIGTPCMIENVSYYESCKKLNACSNDSAVKTCEANQVGITPCMAADGTTKYSECRCMPEYKETCGNGTIGADENDFCQLDGVKYYKSCKKPSSCTEQHKYTCGENQEKYNTCYDSNLKPKYLCRCPESWKSCSNGSDSTRSCIKDDGQVVYPSCKSQGTCNEEQLESYYACSAGQTGVGDNCTDDYGTVLWAGCSSACSYNLLCQGNYYNTSGVQSCIRNGVTYYQQCPCSSEYAYAEGTPQADATECCTPISVDGLSQPKMCKKYVGCDRNLYKLPCDDENADISETCKDKEGTWCRKAENDCKGYSFECSDPYQIPEGQPCLKNGKNYYKSCGCPSGWTECYGQGDGKTCDIMSSNSEYTVYENCRYEEDDCSAYTANCQGYAEPSGEYCEDEDGRHYLSCSCPENWTTCTNGIRTGGSCVGVSYGETLEPVYENCTIMSDCFANGYTLQCNEPGQIGTGGNCKEQDGKTYYRYCTCSSAYKYKCNGRDEGATSSSSNTGVQGNGDACIAKNSGDETPLYQSCQCKAGYTISENGTGNYCEIPGSQKLYTYNECYGNYKNGDYFSCPLGTEAATGENCRAISNGVTYSKADMTVYKYCDCSKKGYIFPCQSSSDTCTDFNGIKKCRSTSNLVITSSDCNGEGYPFTSLTAAEQACGADNVSAVTCMNDTQTNYACETDVRGLIKKSTCKASEKKCIGEMTLTVGGKTENYCKECQ